LLGGFQQGGKIMYYLMLFGLCLIGGIGLAIGFIATFLIVDHIIMRKK